VGELGGAFANVAICVVLFGLLLWALYFAFGPVVLGVPSMGGVLVIIAGVRVSSHAGLAGLVFVVVGLIAIVLVIGMACDSALSGLPNEEACRPSDV
jgi:hypothetical protein